MSIKRKESQKYIEYNIFKSFKYAVGGFFYALNREPNLSIQLFAGVVFTSIALVAQFNVLAAANFILMCIILGFEMINSSIEAICDMIDSEYNEQIKHIKDMAAGAVLIAAVSWMGVIAYQTGVIIFQVLS